jgi:DNA-directed RNA polymerase sigma subunit (sigma70/sigma32)
MMDEMSYREMMAQRMPRYVAARAALMDLRAGVRTLPAEHPADVLTEREWSAITLRVRGGLTLADVAGQLGVTRERIRQLEYKAARKLSEAGLI